MAIFACSHGNFWLAIFYYQVWDIEGKKKIQGILYCVVLQVPRSLVYLHSFNHHIEFSCLFHIYCPGYLVILIGGIEASTSTLSGRQSDCIHFENIFSQYMICAFISLTISLGEQIF